MLKQIVVIILISLAAVGILIPNSEGKEYPARPIQIIVPYTPGSTMDLLARLIEKTAPKYLGQPLITINKPGAGGILAANEVIISAPDGYKVLTTTNLFFAAIVKMQKVSFDPYHLTPLTNFLEYRFGLIVKGDSSWKTFGEMLDYARKNPRRLTWAHPGYGTGSHMAGLLIFRKAGVETVDVPFKGSPEMLCALLGGHITASFMAYGAVKGYVQSGEVRYLLTCSDERYGELTNVPSVTELGFPEVAKISPYIGVYAHKDIPGEVKKTLIEAFRKTYEDPEFKKGIDALEEEPRFGGPVFMSEAIKKSEEVAVPILKEFGLYVGGK